jgi:hypothetical protein
MSAEDLLPGEAMKWVGRVLMGVHVVPYVPTLFSASNQPKKVHCSFIRVLLTFAYAVSDVCC